MKQLKRLDRGGSSMGLATFLQTELGLALIYRGTAKGYRDLTDDQRDDGEMPPWVPKPVGRPPADGGTAARPPQPTAHVWEAHAFSKGWCLSCLGVAEVVDERRNSFGGAQRLRTPDGGNKISQVTSGCTGCNRFICARCIPWWSHLLLKRLPTAPDIDPRWPCTIVCGTERFERAVRARMVAGEDALAEPVRAHRPRAPTESVRGTRLALAPPQPAPTGESTRAACSSTRSVRPPVLAGNGRRAARGSTGAARPRPAAKAAQPRASVGRPAAAISKLRQVTRRSGSELEHSNRFLKKPSR